jgi:hypothetical protein
LFAHAFPLRLAGPSLAGFALLAVLNKGGAPGSFAEGLDSITPRECEAHVKVLASERFAGRDTPSEGLEKAGEYIAERLKEFGLEPGGDGESFFQSFDVPTRVPAPGCSLALKGGKGEGIFEVKKDWLPVPTGHDREARGEPIFAGYAIDSAKYRYSDFARADVRGKVVLALTHEPREKKPGPAFEGLDPTKGSSIFEKARRVAEKGGVALLLVRDPLNHDETTPLAYKNAGGRRPTATQTGGEPPIPVATISLEAAERILGVSIRPLQEKIDASLVPQAVKCPGREVLLVSKTENGAASARNVVAVRKGSDAQGAKQAVVVGAHYDHVGTNDLGQVYFGADDNASGSTALLEVAEAFARTATRRSVVFCWFAGEEAGLLGSDAYAAAPRFPLESTVAMVNTDMVGRGDLDDFSVAGAWDNPDMEGVVGRAQRLRPLKVKVDLEYGRPYFERSDQWNFHKRGVPSLFVSEKDIEHKDYHQPTDSAEKIEAEKVSRGARLLFSIAYLLADEEKTPRRPAPTPK